MRIRLPDLNLWLQTAIVLLLTLGAVMARRQRYRAHGWLQSAMLVANGILIVWIMGPSFHRQLLPDFWGNFRTGHYAIAAIHSIVGGVAVLAATYVVLAAGTPVLPQKLRFKSYKPWMRTAFVLWWIAFLLGVATYLLWYRFVE